MPRKLSFAPSRHGGRRLLRWSMLALAGAGGGMLLGEMVAAPRLGAGVGEAGSYSRLSANPDALAPQGGGAQPCPDCADSYGVAVRTRADRERMSDEFRELGAVDVDPPMPVDPIDDYSFGGRFPDPEPRDRSTVRPVDVASAAPPAAVTSPPDETPLPSPEY